VTRDKVEQTFSDIGKKTKREDLFILFVAGHGITYSKDGSFYYLPVDFRYSQDEDIPKLGISMNDFKKYLAKIQATNHFCFWIPAIVALLPRLLPAEVSLKRLPLTSLHEL